MSVAEKEVADIIEKRYEHGFVTDIETESAAPGLDESTVRFISARKNEPTWMLDLRLQALAHWQTLREPDWSSIHHPPIDYQAISYYSAPKKKPGLKSLHEVDPALLDTYNKLGIPIEEQKALAGVAVDAVFDSVSVATTFRENLAEAGVIFCSISEAIREYPEQVRKYLGSVVSYRDNFFASLNAAVFSDVRLSIYPKGCAARWSCRPAFGLTQPIPGNSSVP